MEEVLAVFLIVKAISVFLLMYSAGYSKACMDIVQHKYSRSIFSLRNNPGYYNPKESWKRKHEKKSWLYKTVLVWTTDFWHKKGMHYSVSLSLGFFLIGTGFNENPIATLIVFLACQYYYRVVFEYNYSIKLMIK